MVKLERAAYQVEERVAVYVGLSTDDYANIRKLRNGDRYFAMDTKQWYRYDQENGLWIPTTEGETARGAYIAGGSVAFANLPPLTEQYLGYVYNVIDAFTTTNDFVEGAGLEFPAGTNVAIVSVPDGQGGEVFKYDVLGNFVDLSGYLALTGGTMQGVLNMAGYRITNVPKPQDEGDAVNYGTLNEVVDTVVDNAKDEAWTITLAAANWADDVQIIQDARFAVEGYVYLISPAPSDLYTYSGDGIYAEDITIAGAMTFNCNITPTVDLTVNIKMSEVK